MMKIQAGLTNHAKTAKITESAIATIGKIRLKEVYLLSQLLLD
ncbi:MAG: hypothetical protein ACLTZB_00735 [Streptococcus salivarius]